MNETKNHNPPPCTLNGWSLTNGIIQGSVLGPILFVIFINDWPQSVLSDVFIFADNTKLFREIKDENDVGAIQSDLNELFNWSETWLLKFHPDKCKSCQSTRTKPKKNIRIQ